jgi:hypothetical protein
MRTPGLTLTTILTLATASANAADLPQPSLNAPPPDPTILVGSIVPNSAFFLGLGASANWMNFGHQHVYAIGTSNVFTDGMLSASGSAQGPTNIHMEDRLAFAPSFQGGYFQRFGRAIGYGEQNSRTIIREQLRPTPTPLSRNSAHSPRSRTLRLCLLAAQPMCAPLRRVSCRKSTLSHSWSRFRSKLRLRRRRSDAFTNPHQVEWPGRFCACRWRHRRSIRRAPKLLKLELAHWRRGNGRRHLLSDPDLVSRFELHLCRDGRPHRELCEPIYRSQFDECGNIGRQLRLEGGDATGGAHDQQGFLKGHLAEDSN